jgi:hypothetical protein
MACYQPKLLAYDGNLTYKFGYQMLDSKVGFASVVISEGHRNSVEKLNQYLRYAVLDESSTLA